MQLNLVLIKCAKIVVIVHVFDVAQLYTRFIHDCMGKYLEDESLDSENVMRLVDVPDLELIEQTVMLYWWLFLFCIIVFVVQFLHLTDRDV